MAVKKFGEVAINFAAMSNGRNNHSHKQATSGDDDDQVLRSYGGGLLSVKQDPKTWIYNDV